jgi:hypothetical protein
MSGTGTCEICDAELERHGPMMPATFSKWVADGRDTRLVTRSTVVAWIIRDPFAKQLSSYSFRTKTANPSKQVRSSVPLP